MRMELTHIYAIQCFIALFIIIDPVGNVPIFLTLLEKYSHKERRNMVRNAVLIATVVLILFTLIGQYIFEFLRVEFYSFKIAAGILLSIISVEMLLGRRSRTKISANIEQEVVDKEDLAVTPLAIPLLTGPGAITTAILFYDAAFNPIDRFILVGCIILVFIISYLVLSRADVTFRLMGRTGTKVFVRLMGLMLFTISVQFIVDGIREAAIF